VPGVVTVMGTVTGRYMLRAMSIAVMLVIIVTGCGSVELASTYRDRDIVVDGSAFEWSGALQPLKDVDGSLGIMNDEENLYVVIMIRDRDLQRRIMMSGMILWLLDATNGYCVLNSLNQFSTTVRPVLTCRRVAVSGFIMRNLLGSCGDCLK